MERVHYSLCHFCVFCNCPHNVCVCARVCLKKKLVKPHNAGFVHIWTWPEHGKSENAREWLLVWDAGGHVTAVTGRALRLSPWAHISARDPCTLVVLSPPTGILLSIHPAQCRARHATQLIAIATKLHKVLRSPRPGGLQVCTAQPQLLTAVPQPYLFPLVPGKRVCSCGRGWSCGVEELPVSGARKRDNQSVTGQLWSGIPGAPAQAEEGWTHFDSSGQLWSTRGGWCCWTSVALQLHAQVHQVCLQGSQLVQGHRCETAGQQGQQEGSSQQPSIPADPKPGTLLLLRSDGIISHFHIFSFLGAKTEARWWQGLCRLIHSTRSTLKV